MSAEPQSGHRRLVDTGWLFQEAKRRVEHAAAAGARAPEAEFFCECGDSRCTERVRLTLAEYEAIRAMPGRFLVWLGHEGAPYRRLVASTDRYSVVIDRVRGAPPSNSSGFGRNGAAT